MHIPDGLLDAKTSLITTGLTVAGIGVAVWRTRKLPPRKVPLLGLSAAFVFAAQMLNFPVASGTSGHLIGAVLTGVLLGPSAAVVVLTSVLTVQALLFADGGITALGANIFNMALVGGVGGWAVYRALSTLGGGLVGKVTAAMIAAWTSTVLASTACAGELVTSGLAPARLAFPAMAGVHMLIGVGEALITALVLIAIAQVRPELLDPARATLPSTRRESFAAFAAFGLLISLGLALFVSPYASEWDDGFEATLAQDGFAQVEEQAPVVPSPIPDYMVPGIRSSALATGLAGVIGTAVLFACVWLVARVLVAGHELKDEPATEPAR